MIRARLARLVLLVAAVAAGMLVGGCRVEPPTPNDPGVVEELDGIDADLEGIEREIDAADARLRPAGGTITADRG